jgi:hypothetical protein
MGKYLKKFSTHTEYDAYINGSDAILPNVSICTTEGDVHYNPSTPPTPTETRVVVKINVESTSSPTKIIANGDERYISYFSAIEIDGVEQPSVTTGYTFNTTGEHTVKYTLADPTTIGGGAFVECTSLTSVDIPNNVTSIGENAFGSCYYITNVNIGSGVTNIGNMAFDECSELISVTILASVPPTIGFNVFNYNAEGRKIYVPSGSVNAYKTAWEEDIEPEDIEPIQ